MGYYVPGFSQCEFVLINLTWTWTLEGRGLGARSGWVAGGAMIEKIQRALAEYKLDGWLFYSFRGSDPIAANILGMGSQIATRRWFYLVPASGEPVKIVHSIEREVLDHLPGNKIIYLPWQQMQSHLRDSLLGLVMHGRPRVAMQYSPDAAIPYLSRVDAGTAELIRSFGVDILSSADLVNRFEAAWTDEQLAMHDEAAEALYEIVAAAYAEIGRRLAASEPATEYDIQQFIVDSFTRRGLVADHPPIVAVNANSAMPHYEPSESRNSPIHRGDFILIDLWAKPSRQDAVYADITWTGYAGPSVPDDIAQVFGIVRDARDAAINFVTEAFSSGRTIHGWQVDDVCRAVIHKAGYGDQFIHRTGHNIHTEVHGNGANIDNLETRDDRIIIPRTCFSIEPGIYLEGRFGVRSEVDMYAGDGKAWVTGGAPQREVLAIG
jgi:Xaa-Pro dipeptidase